MARRLIVAGLILAAAGMLWPLAAKFGLGHLPGDIRIERKGFVFYFPITTCVAISALVTLVVWIFRR
jgi:hypothetical protein